MFRVTSDPPDADAVRCLVESAGCGAVVVFHGTVRDHTGDRRVTHLEYEAFVEMAEAEMLRIGRDVQEAHGLAALACEHRVGRLEVGDVAVVVAASAPHRGAAFAGVEAFIHRLKEDVPIWKKEHFQDGAVWVGTPDDPQARQVPPPGPSA